MNHIISESHTTERLIIKLEQKHIIMKLKMLDTTQILHHCRTVRIEHSICIKSAIKIVHSQGCLSIMLLPFSQK